MNNASKRKFAREAAHARPTLMVAGGVCALLANPAMGVELGEIQVQSALGQPLRASIAIALAPNEQISDQCVYLRAAAPAQGLPSVTRATTTLSGNQLLLRGNTPLREPMMTLQVAVNCPYTAKVQREYLLMLNPLSFQEEAVAESAPVAEVQQAAEPVTAAPRPAVRRPVNVFEPAPVTEQSARPAPAATTTQRQPAVRTPIEAGSSYRVQFGDTLSEIAARIPDRAVNLWSAVNSIHAANPAAFLNGNVDRLIAGSVLNIPGSVTGGATVDVPAQVAATTPQAATVEQTERLGDTPPATPDAAAAPAATVESVAEQAEQPASAPVAPAETALPPVEATVGTAVPDSNVVSEPLAATPTPGPFVEEPGTLQPAPAPQATVSIPNTRIRQAEPVPAPAVPFEEAGSSSSWLVLLGGTGIAIFLALLLFGSRLRELFGARDAVASVDESQARPVTTKRKRSVEAKTLFTRRLSELFSNRQKDSAANPAAGDFDIKQPSTDGYEVAEAAATEEASLANDATAEINLDETIGRANALKVEQDLSTGNVFDTGHDLNVALDYSFASSGEHGNELDFVVDSDEAESPAAAEHQVTEVLPLKPEDIPVTNEDDNYSMSMVLDVTKQNFLAPGRAEDLQATQIDPQADRIEEDDDLAMTSEFDLKILEQDYEAELTAKMALGDDPTEVARNLKEQGIDISIDDTDISMAVDLDATAEITAEMPKVATDSNNDETLIDEATMVAFNEDETDLTEALADSLKSLESELDDTDVTERLDLDVELELISTANGHKSKLG